MAVPRDFFRDLYNAGMTSQPKKRKRGKRERMEHRSIEKQSKENRFIDPRLTEHRNMASRHLDRMTANEIVGLMNREDRKVAIAVSRELPAIGRAVDAIVNGARKGGRLTPYVLGALKHARKLGAATVAVTSNLRMPVGRLAKIVIAPEVGPEVLTGSTRLKAGTSQKMVLNMLSTAAMARLGHVYENLMIDVVITNEKVAERALRILAEASGKSVSVAEHALRAAEHNMRVALVMLKRGVGAPEGRKLIAGARGDLRKALGE